MAASTATETPTLEPGSMYAAYYVDNLRTGAAHQIAIVEGTAAQQMRDRSTEPRRLRFAWVGYALEETRARV